MKTSRVEAEGLLQRVGLAAAATRLGEAKQRPNEGAALEAIAFRLERPSLLGSLCHLAWSPFGFQFHLK